MNLHHNLLPGCVVGDVVDLLFLLRNPLHAFHDFLEHGSLPERREMCQILITPGLSLAGIKCYKYFCYLLEIKGEISGNNANFKQMLHGFKLTLLEVLEDIQVL